MRMFRLFSSLVLSFVIFCVLFSTSAYAARIECFQCGDLLVPVIPQKVNSDGEKYAFYLFALGEEGKLGLGYRMAESLTLNENGRLTSFSTNVYMCYIDVNVPALTDYYKGYWSPNTDLYAPGRVVLWSSVDVYNADGSLYMKGSSPIPVWFDTPVVISDLQPFLNSYKDQISVTMVIGILVGLAGVSVTLVFMWWGVRKVSGSLMKAFKKGKIRI